MFRSPVFSISSVQFFLSTVVLFAAMLYVPQLMIEVHHYTAFQAGIFLLSLLVGLIAAPRRWRSPKVEVMSKFPAIAHLALTVSDLDASTRWYNRVFDTEPAFEMSFDNFDRRVYALPGGQVLGITRHKGGNPGRFDPTVVGLDHVGLNVSDLGELEAWAARLAELGVDNSGVQKNSYGTLLSFNDPDGNAFDFIVAARATSD